MIYLLISDQTLLLKSRLNQLISESIDHIDDFNYVSLDFENNPLEEIIDHLDSPAFGSEKKVVVVKKPYFFKDEKKKLAFTNNLELLENYFKNPNEDVNLIIICPKIYYNSKHKWLKLIEKVGKIENLLIESNEDFKDYAMTLIKRLKLEFEPTALSLFLSRCKDVETLEKEVSKLFLYNSYIDVDTINALVAPPLEENVFELSNAILKKDTKRVMKIYSDLKLLKTEPIMLINLLASQFRFILQVGILRNERKNDDEISSLLKAHPYRVKIAKENIRKHSMEQLKIYLVQLANLDMDIKRGVKDRYIDFEIFLATTR